MRFDVLTLFPDMMEAIFSSSVIGRARNAGLVDIHCTNIRDYTKNKHRKVDDTPYGGGFGMVMMCQPVVDCIRDVKSRLEGSARVIYLSPQGKVLTQQKAGELCAYDNLILLCGHYEGIDDRVLEEVVDENISIGDYVLTGGELGACVLMDAVSRFVPGVLHNDESSLFESHQDNLLEYPQYTRPEIWHDMKVPEILLSGDHKKIEDWRHAQSVERTKERRPDLLSRSYRVSILYFGSGSSEAFAEKISMHVSRYPELLDYNRSKLVRQKRSFGASDLLLVVTDDPEKAGAVLEKVSAHRSLLVFIGLGGKDIPAENPGFLKTFEDKGFRILRTLAVGADVDEEQIAALALDIRKLMDQTEK